MITAKDILFFWRRWRGPRSESTGHKQTGGTPEGSEERFRSLIQNVSDVIIILEADCTVRYDSPAVESVLGYQPGERVGTSGFDYVHPEDVERVRGTFVEALGKPGVQPPIEYRFRHKDGSWRHVETTRNNLLDDPSVGGIVVTLRDVTERKRAEEALKESEERLRKLADAAFEGIIIHDRGEILEANKAYAAMHGCEISEIVGRSALEWVAPEYRALVQQNMLSGYEEPYESVEIRKDGTRIDVEVRGKALSYRGRTVRVAAVRDITGRKRAEEALKESEECYRRQARELALLHQVRTALAQELELSDVFRTVVEAVARTYGYTQVSVYLLEGDTLVCQHQVGYDHVLERIPTTRGIMGRVVRTGRPVLLEDAGADPAFLGAIEGIVSEVCVPLLDEGRVVGTLNVESKDGVKLTEDDLRLMSSLAEHVSIAVGQARLYTRVRESEERFRTVFEKSAVGISIASLDRRLLETNAAYQRMLGYSGEELFGKPIAEISHPEDIPADDELNRALLVGELDSYQREKRCIRKDGEVVWVRPTISVVQNTKGEAQFLIGMVEDITERKRWEERLREAEERYRTLVENVPAVVYMDRLDGVSSALYMSPQAEEMFGYPVDEWLTDPNLFVKLLHPEDKEAVLAAHLRTDASGEKFEVEYRLIARGGRVVWVRDESVIIRDEDEPFRQGILLDITERKEAERKYREAETRYQTLVENIPAVTYIQEIGETSVTTYVSPQIEDMLGYKPEECTSDPEHWVKIMHPADRERVLAEDRHTNETGRPFVMEYRQFAKDGRVVWIRDEATLVRDEEGNPLYWLGVQTDITERKRAEEALRASELRLRTVITNVPVVLFVLDHKGTFTLSEGKGLGVLGLEPGEAVGRSISELYGDKPEILGDVDRALAGEEFSTVREVAGLVFETWYSPLRASTGEVSGVIGVSIDITERKRAEEALEEERNLLRTLIDNLPDYIFVKDAESRFVINNTEHLRVLGATEQDEVVGKTDFDVFPRELAERYYADEQEVVRSGQPLISREEPVMDQAGNKRWLSTIKVPLRDSAGEITGLVGMSRDITERKRAEEMRARLAHQAELRADVSAALAESRTLQNTLQRCTEAMVKHLGAAFARVWTLNEEESVLELRASAGMYTHTDGPHGRVSVGELKIGLIAQERQPHLTNTVTSDPRLSDKEWAKREGMVAFAGYPLIVEDRLVGVMAMFARKPLAEDTIEALASVADVIAQGIERRRAEEALRRSEKSLVEAQRVAHIGNWEYEVEGDWARWSDEMYRIFGFSPGEFVPTYKAFLGLLHPDDKEFIRRSVRQALRSGKRRSVEYRIVRPDGAVRCLHTEYEVLRDESGKPKRLIGTVHDITERKRAEEEIRRLSHYNRNLFEANLAALMTLDAKGTITDVNRSTEEITGFSREKLIGTEVFSYFRDSHRAREWFQEVLSRGAVRGYELDIRNGGEGRTTPVAYNATVYWDERGEVAGVLASARDITDRRRAEEALKESEERYRRLVELSPELIAIHSEGKLVYVNAAGAKLLGARSPEELIGKPVLDFVHPDYVETAKARIRQIQEEGKPADLIEEKFVRLDGQVIDVEVVATPFTYRGKPATQVVARDFTKRKRVEEEMKEANRRLEELAVLKANFTAMVAHELDTPLAVIRGYADMLSTSELGPNDQDRALARIQDETDVLDTLITDVRAAATVEREDFAIKPRQVPVGVLLKDATTFVETLPGNHPLITESVADGQVLADPYRIGQVLRNLLSNAAKYSPDGAPIELRATSGESPGRIRIEVADHGRGVHPDDADRIFEKFGRGRDRSGRKVAGVGLGLYLSRRILQAHGGELTLDPAPGGGSVFGFELKAVR